MGEPIEGNWGDVVEEAVREFAELGVPDFVYDPVLQPDGSGSDDEVSDGLLLVGTRGVILQSKARDLDKMDVDSPQRVEGWTVKNARAGVGDVRTTRRVFRNATDGIVMRSRKGFERVVKPDHEWPGVVLPTHFEADGVVLPEEPNVIYMTLRDWRILNDRLRSTANVVEYVYRAIEFGEQPPLGHERERYFKIAVADQLAAEKAGRTWTGKFPLFALQGDEERQAQVVSSWIDDVYRTQAEGGTNPNVDYLPVLELLDEMPPKARAAIGRMHEDGVAAVLGETSPDPLVARRGGFLRPTPEAQSGVAFLCRSDKSARILAAQSSPDYFPSELASLVLTRRLDAHHYFGDTGPTLGVGEVVKDDGTKLSYFVVLPDTPNVPPHRRVQLWKEWGMWTPDGTIVVEWDVDTPGRNDKCLCGSGKKSKSCHL